ncbi:MAG: phosphatidate cytidylyltransferase [bacterium]
MSNTVKRILSALVLTAIVIGALISGKGPTLFVLLVIGLLLVDEIYCNIFHLSRKTPFYWLSQVFFLTPYILLNYVNKNPLVGDIVLNAALAFNVLLLMFLFFPSSKRQVRFIFIMKDFYPFISGIYIFLPITVLASLLFYPMWGKLVGGLLLLVFSVDIGAWYVGKNFGKHKLWPSVSPKKTVEGALGGILLSVVVTSLYWFFAMDSIYPSLMVGFAIFAIMAQLGDLIQSKLKRIFDVKDSSHLIPGHGGIYDRVDSLLFVTPFYLWMLKYLHYQPLTF